jgi:hypothetical protein
MRRKRNLLAAHSAKGYDQFIVFIILLVIFFFVLRKLLYYFVNDCST